MSGTSTPISRGEVLLFPAQDHEQTMPQEPSPAALFSTQLEEVRPSSGKILAPVDPLTQMPLPILPTSSVPRFSDGQFANWHHHYHPSDNRLLTSVSGIAIRHLRLQLLPVKSRHQAYHDLFIGPEELPETQEERFGHIVLACAGYIPRSAVDVRKDDPGEPVAIPRKMRNRLQTSGEIEVRGQPNITNFIRNHLVLQDFSHVEDSIVEEFITTPDRDRKKFLGHWLLAIASEIAVEPIEPVYRQALDEGLITPGTNLPNLVKARLSGTKTRDKAMKDLHRKLAKQRT